MYFGPFSEMFLFGTDSNAGPDTPGLLPSTRKLNFSLQKMFPGLSAAVPASPPDDGSTERPKTRLAAKRSGGEGHSLIAPSCFSSSAAAAVTVHWPQK